MCGIVGYIGNNQAAPFLLDGMSKLEYRGYDSAGIAVYEKGKITVEKCVGRLDSLRQKLDGHMPEGTMGIGHTRWATHGRPSDRNSHPHTDASGEFVVVHNGIIENYLVLKEDLIAKGHKFVSETDTEVVAHLMAAYYDGDFEETVKRVLRVIEGSYSLVFMCAKEPEKIICTKKDNPLVIGLGEGENFIASDIPAIIAKTRRTFIMSDGEIATVTKESVWVQDINGTPISKKVFEVNWNAEAAEKGGYEHFMLKEINEESEVVKNILNLYTKNNKIKDIYNIKKYKNIDIVACGSASFAGQIGKYYIEKYANIKTEVYYASEYRYQKNLFTKDTLVILISQSGETADTLAALKLAKENGINTLAIVNRRDSSIAREADSVIYTEAGIEVAVATTKAYLAQVLILLLLAFKDNNKETKLLEDLKLLPNLITKYINEYDYSNIANILKDKEHIFYLGRGIDYYLSMEGSLKLKEISYIHSEAFQAGELKHGSISLIDKDFGVVSVVTDKTISDKTISNLKEVSARGAKIITITNIKDNNFADYTILVEDYDEILNPLLVIVPMQMLAYNVAKLRDCDIDKPRNLAKSVTVE